MATGKEGFNRLTGFIEVYPPDTTFENILPWKQLIGSSSQSPAYIETGINGASNTPTLDRVDVLNKVSIKESFKTLTDTCEVIVPRFDNWIIKDARNINNFSLFDPTSEDINKVFAEGSVIRVFLGYDDIDKLMFHGYISEATPTAPIRIKCEDSMWRLKKKTINKTYFPPLNSNREVSLDDFIHEILDGTGVDLDESVLTKEIFFGKKVTFRNSTVARVMDDIKKRGLSVYIRLGKLVIGRTYFDSTLTANVSTKSNAGYKPPLINTEWNVPKGGNRLRVNTMEKKANMVTVQITIGNDRIIQLNVCLNPNEREDIFVPAQVSDSNNKGDDAAINDLDTWLTRKYGAVIDTTGYSQHTATMDSIKYRGRKFNNVDADLEKLIGDMFDYGKDMYFKYFDNGLGGDVTIFGDYGLNSAQSVDVFDPRNPEVWGEYLVTSVSTEWGFGGYRQTIAIGVKIKDAINYIGNIPSVDVFEGIPPNAEAYNENENIA